ncbi:MAG TPA: DUF692 domain-containing protein [Stellaceae bacterium]|jgi:uncharacterized protein (UPF0276 family)|nr:DUF692 domain-containing protein [Stellaceae bacterium]
MIGTQERERAAAAIGVGLRAPHLAEIMSDRPAIGWLEVHAENYMGGGAAPAQLDRIRRDYPLSLHGVGLSLGSAEGIDAAHLARLQHLVARCEPALVSEHLSWSIAGGTYLNDLLPLPYTEESLAIVARHVAEAQDALGRPLLVENPSTYLRFRHSTIAEPDFLAELVRRTGCRLLCDVNNIFVSASNLGFDATGYLDALPPDAVGEIHLAGHARVAREAEELLIDDHGSPVPAPVWALYERALRRFGLVPTLIEWDRNLPALPALLAEARKAEHAALAMVCDDVAAS